MNLNVGLLMYLFSDGPVVRWQYMLCLVSFAVIVMVSSYLLGSINSAIIISKVIYRDDVRRHGSGNPGLTNMLRTFGGKAAGLTLFGDMAKTALSVFIAGVLFGFNYVGGISTGDGFCYVAGLFSVLGHVFPIYYRFKGGKGVLSTATFALILTPIPFLILLLLFVIIVFFSKYVSLGSVSVAVLYPVVVRGYFALMFSAAPKQMPGLCALSVIILAILIVWCHRGNLQRISNRTERKISFGSKKAKDTEDKE